MLVDDHRIIREGIKAMLADVEGIDFVTEAENGEDAIAKLEIYDVDLIVMDIEMPVMNGIEATRKIVSKNPNARILGLTMSAEEETIEAMIQAGAKGYLLKNGGKEELIEAMEKVASGRNYFSPDVSEGLLKRMIQNFSPN